MVKDDLVTKSYLKSELKKAEDRIVGRIIGEFKKTEEEDAAHQFSHSRINDDLGELDERVVKLEKAQKSS